MRLIPAYIAERELAKLREQRERAAELERGLHIPAPPTIAEIERWHEDHQRRQA